MRPNEVDLDFFSALLKVWEWRSYEGEKWEVTTKKKKKKERERKQFLILDNVHISEVAK